MITLEGAHVALITPFRENELDLVAFRRLIRTQLSSGTTGLLIGGTTGESPCLSTEELRTLLQVAREEAGAAVPVIAGIGRSSSKDTVKLAVELNGLADAWLVVTPPYNKPTQAGLKLHFKMVAEATDTPVILYNIPGRTGAVIRPETVAALSQHQNIIGVKDATADLVAVSDTIALCAANFTVLAGDDALTLPILSIGGRGVISASSNVIPEIMAGIVRSFLEGNLEEAQMFHYRALPVIQALFLETNPIPAKTALAMMGMVREEFRPPMCRMGDRARTQLAEALNYAGVIKAEQE